MSAAVSPTTPAVDTSAAAVRLLYEEHGRPIFNYCLHRLGSREDAEDALQTTFLNAFRGLSRGMLPRDDRAWLFAIAQNVCHDRNSSSWKRRSVECKADFDVIAEVIPSPRDDSAELFGLDDALAAMPENQRRAILLREWQGLSYREIADELRLSQSAVETLIFRARRTLAQGLEAPALKKRRLASGLDLSSVLAALKSLLSGGAVVKAAAIAAAAGTATVVATKAEHPARHHKPAVHHKAAVVHHAPVVQAPVSQPLVTQSYKPVVHHAPARHHVAKKRERTEIQAPAVVAPVAEPPEKQSAAPEQQPVQPEDTTKAERKAEKAAKSHGKKAGVVPAGPQAAGPAQASDQPAANGNSSGNNGQGNAGAEHGNGSANGHDKTK